MKNIMHECSHQKQLQNDRNKTTSKFLLFICILLASLTAYCGNGDNVKTLANDDPNAKYRIYPTEAIRIFLKLNTEDGRIWMVQIGLGNNNDRMEIPLNSISLTSGYEKTNGRFALYPTQNMWNFILLDTHDGRLWQVQWSYESENRFVVPIKQ